MDMGHSISPELTLLIQSFGAHLDDPCGVASEGNAICAYFIHDLFMVHAQLVRTPFIMHAHEGMMPARPIHPPDIIRTHSVHDPCVLDECAICAEHL